MKAQSVLFGCSSLVAGNGGIARVGRLIGMVLAEELAAGRVSADGVIFSDRFAPSGIDLPWRVCRGSRSRFVARVNLALPTHRHFIFDCLGMSRAHQWCPLPRRASMAFLCGIEVWKGTSHPKQVAAAAHVDHLISISRHTRDRAVEVDSRFERAELCWLATEEDDAPLLLPRGSGPPRVTILGRMATERYKGHDQLIRCWPAVTAAVPGAVLTVAGTGSDLPRLKKLSASLNISPSQIDFRGFVPESELKYLWAETTVFAMPSRGEGFGLVYVEAMRQGVPIIGSVHDAAPEINLEGVTGYNVNLDRPSELPECLIHLLRHPEVAANLGANGRQRWAQEFRYSAFRDRFVPILRRFIDQ